jgi:GNAT superfamily N-acetyltransferase
MAFKNGDITDEYRQIHAISQKFNFYPFDVGVNIMTARYHDQVKVQTWTDNGKVVAFSIGNHFKKTPSKGENCFELGYFFVLPEYRKKGYFKNHLEQLFEMYKIIYISTRERIVLEILNKYGFKLDKVCDNQKDLSLRKSA